MHHFSQPPVLLYVLQFRAGNVRPHPPEALSAILGHIPATPEELKQQPGLPAAATLAQKQRLMAARAARDLLQPGRLLEVKLPGSCSWVPVVVTARVWHRAQLVKSWSDIKAAEDSNGASNDPPCVLDGQPPFVQAPDGDTVLAKAVLLNVDVGGLVSVICDTLCEVPVTSMMTNA